MPPTRPRRAKKEPRDVEDPHTPQHAKQEPHQYVFTAVKKEPKVEPEFATFSPQNPIHGSEPSSKNKLSPSTAPPLSPLFSDESDGDVSDSSILPGSFSGVELLSPPGKPAIKFEKEEHDDTIAVKISPVIKKEEKVEDLKPAKITYVKEEHTIQSIKSPPRKRPRRVALKKEPCSSLSGTSDIEDLPCSSTPTVTIAELRHTLDLLTAHFNWEAPSPQPSMSVLDSLVRTVLSQATTDVNSGASFRRLKSSFATWADVRDAPFAAVQESIRVAGLSESKARTIRAVLDALHAERAGDLSMEYVRDIADENEARKELVRFKGVGEKTAACVILFGLRRCAFPVDTHVRRLAQRIGWMGPTEKYCSPEQVWDKLNPLFPQDEWVMAYGLHVLLIRLGKTLCKSGKVKPKCRDCPLNTMCATGLSEIGS